MLSAVLHSDVAIRVSIRIMDTFVEMRKYMANTSLLYERLNAMEVRQINYESETDERFERVFEYISEHEESSQKVFFDGQIYDAFSLIVNLIQKADNEITLIDGYVDVGTLNLLSKKKAGVNVTVYTQKRTKLTKTDVKNFNAQYPALEIKYTRVFHDRFLVLDRTTAYHVGASLKDAGKKCFGINLIPYFNITTNSMVCPFSHIARTVPLCPSTILRAMESPIPNPPVFAVLDLSTR